MCCNINDLIQYVLILRRSRTTLKIIKASMEQTWCMDTERGATFSLMLNDCSEHSPGSSWLYSFPFLHSRVVHELLQSNSNNFGFHLSISICSIFHSSSAPVLAPIAIKHGLWSWQSLPIWMRQDPWFNVSSKIQHWERQRGLQTKAFLDTNSFGNLAPPNAAIWKHVHLVQEPFTNTAIWSHESCVLICFKF